MRVQLHTYHMFSLWLLGAFKNHTFDQCIAARRPPITAGAWSLHTQTCQQTQKCADLPVCNITLTNTAHC